MKFIAIFCVLAANIFGSPDTEATRRIFGRYAEADRVEIRRGALCHPGRVKSRVLSEVRGTAEVQGVLSHLVIEKIILRKGVDPDTSEEVHFRGTVSMGCPDYTLFFFRGESQLGTIGLLGVSGVRAQGEKEDRVLADASRSFLSKRFGLVEEPNDDEPKKG